MRALGYARVSTDEQAEKGYSLPEQMEKIQSLCRTRSLELSDVVTDDFTGKILERPGLRRVTELAEARAFDLLICVKLDRLARANHLRRLYEDRLFSLGIRVQFVEQSFEETSSGRLQRGIMGEVAEFEAALITERTTGGRLQKATKKGAMPIGAAPFGYHQISVAEAAVIEAYRGRSGELVVIDEEATIVRRIFALCAEGQPLRTICRTLNAEGLRTRARGQSLGDGKWERSTVHRMLQNEAYVGRRYYRMRACHTTSDLTEYGNPRVNRTWRDRSDWIPMSCPALVSEELFHACQEQLRRNREQLSGRESQVWLLRGVVVCGVCRAQDGRPLRCTAHSGNGQKKLYVYLCNSAHNVRRSHCGTKFHQAKLERMALDALHRAAEPKRLAEFALAEAETRQQRAGDPAATLQAVESELAALDVKEASILDSALASGFSAPVVQRRLEELRLSRAEFTRQAVALRGQVAAQVDPAEAARRGDLAADRLRAALPAAEKDPIKLRELFRLFLDVRIFPDREPEIQVQVPLF